MDNIIRLFRQSILGEDHSKEMNLSVQQSKTISSGAYEKGEILGKFVTDIIEIGENEVEIVIKDGVNLSDLNNAIKDFQLYFKSPPLQYVFHYIDKFGEKVTSDPYTIGKYIKKLTENLKVALPNAKITLSGQYIKIENADIKKNIPKVWLYDLLATLPEIEYPIETVRFNVFENGTHKLTTIINPSEWDLRAVQYAIKSKLKFSQHSIPYSTEPLPLDHPYYQNSNYFNEAS